MAHLILDPLSKNEGRYPPNDYPFKKKIYQYSVKIDIFGIYYSLRQKAKNLSSFLKNIRYQEFKISEQNHRLYLTNLWEKSQKLCTQILSYPIRNTVEEKYARFKELDFTFVDGEPFNYSYPTFLFCAHVQLDEFMGKVLNCLTPEKPFNLNESEQEENQKLLNDMLHQNLYSISTTKNKPAKRKKKDNHTNKNLSNNRNNQDFNKKTKNKPAKEKNKDNHTNKNLNNNRNNQDSNNKTKKNPALKRENMQKPCLLPSETRQEGQSASSEPSLKSSDATRVAESRIKTCPYRP